MDGPVVPRSAVHGPMGPFLKVRAICSKRTRIVVPAVPIDSGDEAGSNEAPWTTIGWGPFWTVPWSTARGPMGPFLEVRTTGS